MRKRIKAQNMSPEIKDIAKIFETLIHRGHDSKRLFHDWIDLIIFAFQMDDEKYLEIVGRYNNSQAFGNRDIDLFADMFGMLVAKMEENQYYDYLGEIYECCVSFGEHGQFFTPMCVCEMMAQISGKVQGSVNDPCAGAGRMALAHAKHFPSTTYVNQDIDIVCVKMSVINMFLNGIESVNIWGNSLLVEQNKTWITTFKTGIPQIIYKENSPEVQIAVKKKKITMKDFI